MHSDTFVKLIPSALADLEVELQTVVYEGHGFCPKVLGVRGPTCADGSTEVRMERLHCLNLAELYETDADTPQDIPEAVWDEVRRMVRTVFEVEGIECIDITPYNFMQEGSRGERGRVWMIDFGHATYTEAEKGQPPGNWFLREFVEGANSWNPDFR